MEKLFLVYGNEEFSYERLFNDVSTRDWQTSLLRVANNNPYDIFAAIIHCLVHDYPIEILDGDFSDRELEELGIGLTGSNQLRASAQINVMPDVVELLEEVQKSRRWTLSLYTSGTTGRPKKVEHDLRSITRNVKLGDKFDNNVWAFAYNPTHMAGLQVFFQALFNRNTMVYAFGDQRSRLPEFIDRYGITNISATATYYRTMLPVLKRVGVRESVRSIAFGGENYDPALEKGLREVFPNARTRNIYASTEAGSLFAAQGETFEVPTSIRQAVRIGDNNELLLHRSLLGTSESFVLNGEWFHTGDLVELVEKDRFRFMSRQSELINVGGYKVNPLEVESILSQVPGVTDILVRGKANSVTGQILVADVVMGEGCDAMELKKSIKHHASMHLQEWKVPRIITFVDDIPKTRTGKKARS
jgi:acyl-coenzyme A synthetase/AMP-(fatty) acid ligase